ncbi:MAG: copper-binding protein [Pseudomonadota bacterium]
MRAIVIALAAVAVLFGRTEAAEHRVTIEGGVFSPLEVSVSRGDEVVFVNADGCTHTVTATDGSFATGWIEAGATARILVPAFETVDFVSDRYPSMRGRIETD